MKKIIMTLAILFLLCSSMAHAYNVKEDYIIIYHHGEFSQVTEDQFDMLLNPFVSDEYKSNLLLDNLISYL